MVINKNLRALNVFTIKKYRDWEIEKRAERLSTGNRINTARDDASGLAVSEKMLGQINGLRQAERNTEDGVSLVQTAEGYLSETSQILRRIRNLAVQAASSTYTPHDRVLMQVEVSQLVDEIDHIASSAHFNNHRLFNGDLSRYRFKTSMFIQHGPNDYHRDRIYIGTMSARALKLRSPSLGLTADLLSDRSANQTIGILDNAIHSVAQQRDDLGAYQLRYERTSRNLMNTYETVCSQSSVMRDADLAEELIELTKDRILSQVGNAQLAQANLSTSVMARLISSAKIFG